MNTFTQAQQRALFKLTDQWRSAYDMQERLTTLNALVRRGVADRRYLAGSMFFPRIQIEFKARLIKEGNK